jgi:hypothetical protein
MRLGNAPDAALQGCNRRPIHDKRDTDVRVVWCIAGA